jgi:hypothetical protein
MINQGYNRLWYFGNFLKRRWYIYMENKHIIVNRYLYNKQLGAIATAMAEMDDNSPASFEVFINRMVQLGVIEVA